MENVTLHPGIYSSPETFYIDNNFDFSTEYSENITISLTNQPTPTDVYTAGRQITTSWALFCSMLFVVILFTILGNLVVLVAPFVERRLRTTLIYFVMNLALTDFLVGLMAMNFYTVDILLGYWPFGEVMCGIWIFFDYGMTFASVFTLVAISLDRFWSVQSPLHYRIHNNRRKCVVMITTVWFLMLAIWLAPCIQDRVLRSNKDICIWEPSDNREFVFVIAILGHHGPCAIIVVCYVRVVVAMRKRLSRIGAQTFVSSCKNTGVVGNDKPTFNRHQRRSSDNGDSVTLESGVQTSSRYTSKLAAPKDAGEPPQAVNHQKKREERERRSFVLLSYIIGSYLFCWVPFHVVFDVSAVDPTMVPDTVFRITFWLTYFNSTLNPLLYAYSSHEFRAALRRIIRCQFKRR